ncbi:FAD-binding domain PCMH-type [Arabidopsis thaliana x Arabidopsis arenosa]|uniref:FAD-binding domain PCMH-type n=1 Tax=Arabidopsis thaliana x Arabidopsis arenosa TaxID=1240361 RepID=A0A8T1XF92_9BRAS|nr:FAD-binding domain PCMH-type [Arabidopsis thaliana x Arabidopsis arenosa]
MFSQVLESTAQNLRFLEKSMHKPGFIFRPIHESQVQASIICSKKLGIHFRVRSGGHDFEALSYVSRIEKPFILLDMSKLRQITVDIKDNSAWIQPGATFGELYYRIKLVPVPETLTVFTVTKTLEQDARLKIISKWQRIASKLIEELHIRVELRAIGNNGNKTVTMSYKGQFLGEKGTLMKVMKKAFPELGLTQEDCIEMSWIETTLFRGGFATGSPIEVLLQLKSPLGKGYFKATSDAPFLNWTPYGGMMAKIPESEIPFPHRNRTLFKILYQTNWPESDKRPSRHINWIKDMYSYMTPYVSSNPRQAYVNYRDLDFGQNRNNSKVNFIEAKIWGAKYFKDNFNRLVRIKTKVDPDNFFRHEQSIPTMPVRS